MNSLQTQLKNETMRRIYAVFLMRKLVGRIAVKTYVLLALVYVQAKLVFVKQIFANMPSITDVGAVYNFYSYAILNTRASVQIATFLGLAIALWLFRDLFKKEDSFGYSR